MFWAVLQGNFDGSGYSRKRKNLQGTNSRKQIKRSASVLFNDFFETGYRIPESKLKILLQPYFATSLRQA